MREINIPLEYIKQCFKVRCGTLYWLERPPHHFTSARARSRVTRMYAGKAAGRTTPDGRKEVHVNYGGKRHTLQSSRVAWLLAHGDWPTHMLGRW